MFILILFSFLAGIATILSPCILPILPIILAGSVNDSKSFKKPLGVIVGFISSFVIFTLFLSTIVKALGISADSLRTLSVVIIGLFGASMLFPQVSVLLEKMFSYFSRYLPISSQKSGFWGGVLLGLTLGLLWTPCVGPILASVISLAISGSVTFQSFLLILAYSLGTAIPMFAIMWGGNKVINESKNLRKYTPLIQKIFAILMILTSLAIAFNFDRKFQTFIIEKLPNYGANLTKIEDNDLVKDALNKSTSDSQNKFTKSVEENVKSLIYPEAPKLQVGGEWINSPPLDLSKLRGKVVLIDFWTYTCINCQRTLPYLKTWWEKYEKDGLIIIGVHSPEFEFEKNINNLKKAILDFDIKYPVMQDNDFATWKAYENRYWPAKYFIDKDGKIRHTHFGEGEYNESEEWIQKLLKETGKVNYNNEVNNPEYSTFAKTPETYLGFARLENIDPSQNIYNSKKYSYTFPNKLSINHFALSGDWSIMEEYANPSKNSKLRFDFESKEVFLVMRPVNGSGQVRVALDGASTYLGSDTQNAIINVDTDRLYKLINLPNAGNHILDLEFLDDNVEVYAFTFG